MEAELAQDAPVQQSIHKIRRNLASLKVLCQRAIHENLQYFEGKEHLFSYLPSTVLDYLAEDCPDSIEHKIIKFIAQEQTQKIRLQFNTWHSEDVALVCRLIQEKCTNLRRLHLYWSNKADEEIYCTLLNSLPHLQELELVGPLSDRLLESLFCTQLRSLDIGHVTSEVSPEKLCQLIHNFPELEDFRGYCLEVSNSIVGQALLSLQKLSFLECDGIEKFIEEVASEQRKLNLKGIDLKNSQFSSGFSISDLSEILPCLHVLQLDGFPEVSPFLNFEHVTKLSLNDMPSELFIKTYASTLTYLEITESVHTIDLSMIGHFCVNLEMLSVVTTGINPCCSYKLGPDHFSELKEVFFIHSGVDYVSVPDSVMYRILCAPELRLFHSDYVEPSHTLICKLIAEAEEKGVVLSQMKYFGIPAKEISADTATKLVCIMPKLETVMFLSMPKADFHIIYRFVNENLSDVLMMY